MYFDKYDRNNRLYICTLVQAVYNKFINYKFVVFFTLFIILLTAMQGYIRQNVKDLTTILSNSVFTCICTLYT